MPGEAQWHSTHPSNTFLMFMQNILNRGIFP